MTLQEIKNNNDLTALETSIIDYLHNGLSSYFGESFSDIDCNDIARDLKMNVKSVKGVIGSLCKKEIVFTWETGTGFDCISFCNQEEMEF